MSQKSRRRDGSREQFWRKAISQRQGSGLTIRAYCHREGLAESAYHFWRGELVKRDGELNPLAARRRGGKVDPQVQALPTFAPVAVRSAASEPARLSPVDGLMVIEIVLSENVRVRVGRGVDAQLLDQVLRVVESRVC